MTIGQLAAFVKQNLSGGAVQSALQTSLRRKPNFATASQIRATSKLTPFVANYCDMFGPSMQVPVPP
jgi:hypothetical protein